MAGKVLHDKLLPTGEKLHKMIEQFRSDCFLAVHQMYHPNIVKYYGICDKPPYKFPMILQEYIAENLTLFLKRTKDTLTFFHKLKLSLEMASGLQYLHLQLIVHKNLHPSHILIDRSGCAKISDFVVLQLNEIQSSSLYSDHVYIAPEVRKHHKHCSYQSDIFSLGILNLHVFTEVTLTVERLHETVEGIKYGLLKQLICSCINDIVIDRPDASGVCQLITEIQNSPTAVAYDALTSKVSYMTERYCKHKHLNIEHTYISYL